MTVEDKPIAKASAVAAHVQGRKRKLVRPLQPVIGRSGQTHSPAAVGAVLTMSVRAGRYAREAIAMRNPTIRGDCGVLVVWMRWVRRSRSGRD